MQISFILLTAPSKCTACGSRVRPAAVTKAACKHKYCPCCLCTMGAIALQNKTWFPVQCCRQAIPAEQVASVMNSQKAKLYISRVKESAIPPAKRWYCPRTACGQLIPPGHIKTDSKFQACPHCRALICSSCRDLAHEDRECTEDPDLIQTLALAGREHWQRCYGCRTLVGKAEGCNHMICLCGTSFW